MGSGETTRVHEVAEGGWTVGVAGRGREVTGQEREKGGRVVLMELGLSEKVCDSIKSNRQCENTGLGVGPANK